MLRVEDRGLAPADRSARVTELRLPHDVCHQWSGAAQRVLSEKGRERWELWPDTQRFGRIGGRVSPIYDNSGDRPGAPLLG